MAFLTNFVAGDAEHGTNANIQAIQSIQAVQSVSPIIVRISSSRSTTNTRVQDTRVFSLRYEQIPENSNLRSKDHNQNSYLYRSVLR